MRLRLILHVFEGDPTPPEPRVEEWETEYDPSATGTNPLLLIATGPFATRHAMFSLDRVEGDVAIYHPCATSPRLPLLRDLPKFGYRRVEP